MWEELQYDLNNMGTCTLIDPLHEVIDNINRTIDLLNPAVNTTTRPSVRCTFPISNLYIPDYPDAPVFRLNVDLRLFRCLLWYKGYTGLVSHYRIHLECLFLLKAVQFIHAVQVGTSITVEDAYIQHLSSLSLSAEKITIIRQRIKTSLFQRFEKSLTDVENVINTILTTIGNVPTSLNKYSQIPLQEGDIFSFYGHIYTDIPDISKFAYRIDLYLTDTPIILPQYSQVSTTITDTFIMMSRTASLSDLRNIVTAYIPSNLSSTAYREVVLDLYPASTVFAVAIQEADMYSALYTSTGHYIYEMYAIYIWANITLYYHLSS